MVAVPFPGDARLRFVERENPHRARLEQHIHQRYAQTYGADIRHFLPTLIAVEANDGHVLGVMGVRPAAREALFLEQYLDDPVEQVLGRHLGVAVERLRLAELGNLAAGLPGTARMLILALSAYLRGAGFDWVVFTAVPAVRNAFARLDLQLVELAEADGARLGTGLAHWGSYYTQRPVVVACDVHRSYAQLQHVIALEHSLASAPRLWRSALALGEHQAGVHL